jgi:hypothetical protein
MSSKTDWCSFLDLYSSLNPTDVAFFGNRSLVVHNAANARVACANFMPVSGKGAAKDAEGDDC